MSIEVDITWHGWEPWEPTEAPRKLKKRFEDNYKIESEAFKKSVYVIRLAVPVAIRYPSLNDRSRKYTPVVYVGEGSFGPRINNHKKWATRLQNLHSNFQPNFEVAICFPRADDNPDAHKVFEAHLLSVFFERYGSLPLKNKNHEYMKHAHEYRRSATNEVLGPGRGNRYLWAIEPLPSNPFADVFKKTHASHYPSS